MLHAQHDAATLAERAGGAFAPIAAFPWEAGVDVFFVISGFIMVYASAPLFTAPGGGRTFLARRIARIVPIYWAVTDALSRDRARGAGIPQPRLPRRALCRRLLSLHSGDPAGRARAAALWPRLDAELRDVLLRAVRARARTLAARRGARPCRRRSPRSSRSGLRSCRCRSRCGSGPTRSSSNSSTAWRSGSSDAEGVRLGPVPRALLSIAALAMLVAVATRHGELATAFRALAYGIPAAMLVAALAFGRRRRRGRPPGPGAAPRSATLPTRSTSSIRS